MRISLANALVDDQDKALRFYTETDFVAPYAYEHSRGTFVVWWRDMGGVARLLGVEPV